MSNTQKGNTPVVVWDRELLSYDMGPGHLMRPERAAMAVSLVGAYGLFDTGHLAMAPSYPMRTRDLLLVHSREYLSAVRAAGEDPDNWTTGDYGLDTPDTPAFPDMLEASRSVCGASSSAVSIAVDGGMAFAPAGGLHHAHRNGAAGFCVLNDAAAAIAVALRDNWGLRVAYLDIDAHHGDGVQEAFWNEPRVLTVSVHCSGHHLYPGTGFAYETGGPLAPGSVANLGLPPGADDACYRMAWESFADPLIREFEPDVIVAQMGADALATDTITTMGLTLRGHEHLSRAIISLSRGLCGGRLAALGGGGYGYSLGAPRAWAMAMAGMAGERLPEHLPPTWLPEAREVLMENMGLELLQDSVAAEAAALAEASLPGGLRDDGTARVHFKDPQVLLKETSAAISEAWVARPEA